MAATESEPQPASVRSNAVSERGLADDETTIHIGIKDANWLEWAISLPVRRGHSQPYSIEVELAVPGAAVELRSAPWSRIQTLTALDGKELKFVPEDEAIDAVRRSAIDVKHLLGFTSAGFPEHCRESVSNPSGLESDDFRGALIDWLEKVLVKVEHIRIGTTAVAPEDPPRLALERKLFDEFVSVHLLDTLAVCEDALQKAIRELQGQSGARIEVFQTARAWVAGRLTGEARYRRSQQFLCPEASAAASLTDYVERSAYLENHFTDTLWLDLDSCPVDERQEPWTRALPAVLACGVAFLSLQILVYANVLSAMLGSSLAVLALVASVLFVVGIRGKELEKGWWTETQPCRDTPRETRGRLPARLAASRDLVVRARERFFQTSLSRTDPFDLEAGVAQPRTRIRLIHEGTVLDSRPLALTGARHIRQIFRYDLSALLPHLDDLPKRVPLLKSGEGSILFAETRRPYHIPIEIMVTVSGRKIRDDATVVLDRAGLQGVRRDTEQVAT